MKTNLKEIRIRAWARKNRKGVKADIRACRRAIRFLKKEIKKHPDDYRQFTVVRPMEGGAVLYNSASKEVKRFDSRLTNLKRFIKDGKVTILEDFTLMCSLF